MSQLGVKLVSFNGAKIVGRIPATGVDFVIVTGRRSGILHNGVACMGRKNKLVTEKGVSLHDNGGLQKWRIRAGRGDFVISDEVSLHDNGGLQKWRIRAGRGDFVISDKDLRVESEEREAPLLVENGWRVRRLVRREEEMRRVADVQAEAFYSPMGFFNEFFFEIFKGEVLAGLLYRLRNSAPNRYACLVAETEDKPDSQAEEHSRLVGVVDVTVLRDDSVLQFLEDAHEYLYVSGIAVLTAFRRRKVATILLKACDLIAMLWNFDYLVLRAYEDDMGARKLYTKAGYRIVSKDPMWMTSWIGRRRRVLMIKRTPPAQELNPLPTSCIS